MTIDQIVESKYKSMDKKREVLSQIQNSLALSVPHFYRKRNGKSPLSLEQALKVSKILKVPVSKLMILVVCVCLCAGCGETQPATYPAPAYTSVDSTCFWLDVNYMSF